MAKTKEEVKAIPSYTKEQFLASKTYATERDLLNALLEDGKTYTKDQVNSMVDSFMKGKVK